MRWWPWRREPSDAQKTAEAAAAKLRAVRRQTPGVLRLADTLDALPPAELAERLRRAMTVREA